MIRLEFSFLLLLIALLLSQRCAAQSRTSPYDDAKRAFDEAVKAAKQQLQNDLADKKQNPEEARDRCDERIADVMAEFAISVSRAGAASKDLDQSIDLVGKAKPLFAAAMEYDRQLVTKRLLRQETGNDQKADPKRTALLRTDPASSFQDFCQNFVGRVNKTKAIIDSQYQVDLRKTDSLITPYLGTLEVKDVRYAKPAPLLRYRFTIACQKGRWVMKRVEELNDDLADNGWQDTTRYDLVSTFVKAIKEIPNP